MKELIKKFIKENKLIMLMLLVLAIYKLYYLMLTWNQPLWFDEAVYLVSSWTYGGVNTFWGIEAVRPPLFPLILTPFALIGLEETFARIFCFLSGIFSVFILYLLGKDMFDNKIALLASFMLAFFWSFNFWSYRVLVDVPLTLLVLITFYVFIKANNSAGKKYYLLTGLFLGLSFLMKFTTLMIAGIIGLTMLFKKQSSRDLLKNSLCVLIPLILIIGGFLIFQDITYGDPMVWYKKAMDRDKGGRDMLTSTIDQMKFSMDISPISYVITFLIGFIIILFNLIMGYDEIIKNNKLRIYLLLVFWIIISYIAFGYLGYGGYIEERYYFIFYPALYLVSAVGFIEVIKSVRERFTGNVKHISKILIIILVVVYFGSALYFELPRMDDMTKIKVKSYTQLKEGGIWLNQNTLENVTIITNQESPEFIYYSKRKVYTEGNYTRFMENFQKADYYVALFYFEPDTERQKILQEVFSNNSLFTPIMFYEPRIAGDQKTGVPILTIFKIK